MLIIPGQAGRDLCDERRSFTRRELLRVGGSAMLGLSLGSMLELQSAAAAQGKGGGPGWGKAKSIILVFLQGGPSHLDLWDPKENLPDNMKSPFTTIPTKLPGVYFTELLPQLANVTDKITLIRSMSYTPVGLFNHTAAMYQMMTGYTTDKVSPSGQLEPPSPKDFPNFGSNIVRLKAVDVPMLPFVMLPRPLQADLDHRGMLSETLVVAIGEFGRSPQRGVSTSGNDNSSDGRDHWPYCYTAAVAGAGIKRGNVHGESDQTGSSPRKNPVHPCDLLATIFHAFGIDPATLQYNHLNQPRELGKGNPVTELFDW